MMHNLLAWRGLVINSINDFNKLNTLRWYSGLRMKVLRHYRAPTRTVGTRLRTYPTARSMRPAAANITVWALLMLF